MADNCTKNLYAILNSSITASYEELKRNYQQLIREYHPDKSGESEEHSIDRFREIDEAWKVLRDQQSRKIYDATLMQQNNYLIYAELEGKQLDFKGQDSITYSCRCGSDFIILRSYLDEEGDCIIECSDCSNCIVIR